MDSNGNMLDRGPSRKASLILGNMDWSSNNSIVDIGQNNMLDRGHSNMPEKGTFNMVDRGQSSMLDRAPSTMLERVPLDRDLLERGPSKKASLLLGHMDADGNKLDRGPSRKASLLLGTMDANGNMLENHRKGSLIRLGLEQARCNIMNKCMGIFKKKKICNLI
jgi:hypothetical protein